MTCIQPLVNCQQLLQQLERPVEHAITVRRYLTAHWSSALPNRYSIGAERTIPGSAVQEQLMLSNYAALERCQIVARILWVQQSDTNLLWNLDSRSVSAQGILLPETGVAATSTCVGC